MWSRMWITFRLDFLMRQLCLTFVMAKHRMRHRCLTRTPRLRVEHDLGEAAAARSAPVEIHALERRRGHLCELHDDGLVDRREWAIAAEREQREQPDDPAVECRERRGQPGHLRSRGVFRN